MSLFIPKPKPLYAPMLSTFGGGSIQGFKSGAAVPNLPTPTLLHLENPNSNFNASGSSYIWTATVGPSPTFIGGGFSTGTDSDGNSFMKYPSPNSVQSFGFCNITLPSNMCVISVIEEDNSKPLIIEHSSNANNANGMYHYSDETFVYGVRRSGTFCGLDPTQANGSGTEDPVNNATKTAFGSNLPSTNSLTDMFYSSKFGGKRNGSIQSGSIPFHGTTNKDLYIGGRGGASVLFTGKLYEVYMTDALSASDFDDAIAYFEHKFSL
tara:strand:+ start:151 stop:948 length:798 start_codon:yes stop_codon:yes gene_type:complete